MAITATGCSRRENLIKCQSADPDTRIAGCTALIQTGQDTPRNLSVIYNNRGSAYNTKRDYDRAIQDFNEAIRLNPNDSDNYRELGIACYGKGDYDRAIQDYNLAIHLNSNDASAFYRRGDAFSGRGLDYDH
jgi:tetratricopeptide (TPR) repeat protein